jgi:hypothetical protein
MAKKTPRLRIDLRVILYREDGKWLAHCLELDIVAEGATPQEAIEDIVDLCNLQVRTALEDGDLQSVFRPAPPEIWKMFFMGEEKKSASRLRKAASRVSPSRPVERFETREFELV